MGVERKWAQNSLSWESSFCGFSSINISKMCSNKHRNTTLIQSRRMKLYSTMIQSRRMKLYSTMIQSHLHPRLHHGFDSKYEMIRLL
ncbi:hypothetical protein CDAR_246551 [Caerostris darwini]|uniref:Uncharacterized protein n=1 Tax=Caerostris darwini TaxID=1538125 RepID=A0AAV4TCA2_9ARAC|nr:hypothetical protein CDAR_246551 [Caerostris darwini]